MRRGLALALSTCLCSAEIGGTLVNGNSRQRQDGEASSCVFYKFCVWGRFWYICLFANILALLYTVSIPRKFSAGERDTIMPRTVLGDVTERHADSRVRGGGRAWEDGHAVKSYLQQRFARKASPAAGAQRAFVPKVPAEVSQKRGCKRHGTANSSPPKRRRVTLAATLSAARRKVLSKLEDNNNISSAGKQRIEKSSTPVSVADSSSERSVSSPMGARNLRQLSLPQKYKTRRRTRQF